jgi:choline dehydrogenase-like flavoprotein
MSFYDVVIVGSGFGGAVMAARIGAYVKASLPGKKVLVLEKGDDGSGKLEPASDGPALNAQGNRYRQTFEPEVLARVSELHGDPSGAYRSGVSSMNVATGRGMGGGSIVYDGVSLRAPTESFEQMRDGRRLWPALYTRTMLDPYYAIVEKRLSVVRLAWTDKTVPHWQLTCKRDLVFAEGCRKIGVTAAPLKVATTNDANEGWWNQGQRFEGRQDLTKNYLLDAKDAGVELRSGCDVETIAPTASGYVVTGHDQRRGARAPFDIECTMLVVAGGSVGSTALFLRSEKNFEGERRLDPAQTLGRFVSANGDYGVTGMVGAKYERTVEGHKGKPMSSFCPSYWKEHQFILIPFYAAPFYLSLGQPSTLLRPKDPNATGRGSTSEAEGERDWGLAYKKRLAGIGPRLLTMGCLALDACEGEIRLRADGKTAQVGWAGTAASTERRWSAAVDVMRRIYEALDGEMFLDSYRKDGTVNTAHPLGGCRMTTRDDPSGVVDPNGEVLGNPNLFVIDGAAIPSALGVNPSLTIAAVAESIADRLIRGLGTTDLAERLANG